MQQFDLKVYNLIVLQMETIKQNTWLTNVETLQNISRTKFSYSINGMYIVCFVM